MTTSVVDDGERRVLAPLGRRALAVTRRRELGPYIVLSCEDPAGPRPAAGQFYMLATERGWGGGEGERPFLPRAFSVLRAPTGGTQLEFMLEDVGPGTRRLAELGEGDALVVLGPLGVGFQPPGEDRRALLVGGGVGIAPLAIWQDQLAAAGARCTALLGFRSAAHAAAAQLLHGARLATDDGGAGHHGYVTDLLLDELHLDPDCNVYACGPPPMLEQVRVLCAEHEVPAQLALESGMACGFGACFGCVVHTHEGYVRLCLEGPVIDAARLDVVPHVGAPG